MHTNRWQSIWKSQAPSFMVQILWRLLVTFNSVSNHFFLNLVRLVLSVSLWVFFSIDISFLSFSSFHHFICSCGKTQCVTSLNVIDLNVLVADDERLIMIADRLFFFLAMFCYWFFYLLWFVYFFFAVNLSFPRLLNRQFDVLFEFFLALLLLKWFIQASRFYSLQIECITKRNSLWLLMRRVCKSYRSTFN